MEKNRSEQTAEAYLNSRPEAAAYSPSQRLLLLGVLALGILMDLGIRALPGYGRWSYGLFWTGYLLVFYLLNWSRPVPSLQGEGESHPLCRNVTAWILAAAAVTVCFFSSLHQSGSDADPAYSLDVLVLLNYLAIPLLLMIHMAFSVRHRPLGREWTVPGSCLTGFFLWPFNALGRFFGAIGSLWNSNKRKNTGVLLGFAIGIPLLIVVLALLFSADQMMASLFQGLVSPDGLGQFFIHLFVVLTTAALFYSFLFNTAFRKASPLLPAKPGTFPASAFLVILSLLAAAYGVFTYVQFKYFFSGVLPEGITYSAYARQGFGQLMAVSIINFSVTGLSIKKAPRTRGLTIMNGLVLLFTGLILYSAALRLMMYTSAYGLTMMRILPMWLMAYLGVMTLLFLLRLICPRLPLTRAGLLMLAVWYVVLNVPDWAGVITRYNGLF